MQDFRHEGGAMSVQTFAVSVEREGRWWVFTIPELGTGGQARSLVELDSEARAVAAMWLDVEPETVAVQVAVHAPAEALAEWEAAEREDAAARAQQATAAVRRRAVVVQLRKSMSAADVGTVLGISRQRVYQLERTTPQAATAAPAPGDHDETEHQ